MIYLHIGLWKSGSTFIQSFAWQLLRRLCVEGYSLPRIGIVSGQHKLVADALKLHEAPEHKELLAQVGELFRSQQDQSFILTSEFFQQNLLFPEEIARTRQLSRDHEMKIVLYIREFPEWIKSIYSHETKKGRNGRDIDQFIVSTKEAGLFNLASVVRNWAEIFGPSNIRVRSVDPESLTGGTLAYDFLEAIGIDRNAIDISSIRRISRNETPHWSIVEFCRGVRLRVDEDDRWTNAPPKLHPACVWVGRMRDAAAAHYAAANIENEPVAYLTSDSFEDLRDLYNRQIDTINGLLPNHCVPTIREHQPQDRPRLPSYEMISENYIGEIATAIAHANVLEQAPDVIRQAVDAVLSRRGR